MVCFLLEKQKAQSGREDPERVVPNFYYVLSHLPVEYKKLSSEHQKILRTLPRQGRAPVNAYHRTMTYQDLASVADLVQEPDEKERLQEIANALAKKTLRGELSEHWWLPLDEISYLRAFDDMMVILTAVP